MTNIDDPEDAAHLEGLFNPVRQKIHEADVFPDFLVDPGANDLDGNLFSAEEFRHVDLADGRRRHGLGLKVLEDLVQRPLELTFDHALDLGKRSRGDLVLKLLELLDVLGRENIRPRAHQLPQLDEARTQLFESKTHPDRRGKTGFARKRIRLRDLPGFLLPRPGR